MDKGTDAFQHYHTAGYAVLPDAVPAPSLVASPLTPPGGQEGVSPSKKQRVGEPAAKDMDADPTPRERTAAS